MELSVRLLTAFGRFLQGIRHSSKKWGQPSKHIYYETSGQLVTQLTLFFKSFFPGVT